ncbi:MAG: amidohydrolase family protein [Armatimonadota bacterium]
MAIIDVRVQIGTTPTWGTPFTEGHLARMMEKYGIERTVVSSTIANSCDFIRGNAFINDIAGKGPIFGCAVVNTQYRAESIDNMRKYLSLPSFVALSITSGTPGRHVTLDECDDILNSHRRFAKPVMLDVSSKEGVLAANEIAKAFPGIKFILMSMGGAAWRTAIAMADNTLNLVLEISGSPSPEKVRLGVETVGAHRMVYGSNLPFADPAFTIGLLADGGISDLDRKMILEGTAKRLFGWARQQPTT